MAGAQKDSGTTLNPGVGGDVVRDLAVTLTDGTTAKQQVLATADPVDQAAVQRVQGTGEALVAERDLQWLMVNLIAHLKVIGRMQAAELGHDFDQMVEDVLQEVAP